MKKSSHNPDSRPARMMEAARERNRSRNASDRKHGWAAPGDCPADVFLMTVFQALHCGISMRDWKCVAEAAAMVEDKARDMRRGSVPTK